jgi:hypothetical protein
MEGSYSHYSFKDVFSQTEFCRLLPPNPEFLNTTFDNISVFSGVDRVFEFLHFHECFPSAILVFLYSSS